MSKSTLTTEQILTLCAETPTRIAELTTGLASVQVNTAPPHGDWSVNDVLAHLRACADVWGNNIMAILAENTPTLPGVNPRAWIKKTDYPSLEFHSSFRAFTTQRSQLLALLEPLPPESWSRTAMVTGMLPGQVFERTMLSYAEKLARHERLHLKQLERIVSTIGTADGPHS